MIDLSSISATSTAGKLLRAPLGLIPSSTVVRIIQGPLAGFKWCVGAGTHGCWLGTYERRKQQSFLSHVSAGMVVFDIGANAGFYTLLASKLVGKEGHVYSFEPAKANVQKLKRHVLLNGLQNVTIVEAAVANSDGQATFAPGENDFTGRLSPNGGEPVRTVTLDSFCKEIGFFPALLKIDVEGCEVDVLSGAERVLADWRPIIFLATHGRAIHDRCLELLGRNDYQVAALHRSTPDELIARPMHITLRGSDILEHLPTIKREA